MTERPARGSMTELEAALDDLATALAIPPTPDLATTVGARLRAPGRVPSPPRVVRRSLRRSLLLAAALVLLIVGGAVAVRLGLDLLSVETGPIPSPVPSPVATAGADASRPPGSTLGLGAARSLDEVRTDAPFTVSIPAALGPPEAVYVGGADLRGQVAFVYAARDDLPSSPTLGGAGLLITQNQGAPDDGLAHKLVDMGVATIDAVTVDGARGLWISGEPHVFWYLAPDGAVIQESRRLVGDTLVWERDGVLYRIEGSIPLARAMEVAASMR